MPYWAVARTLARREAFAAKRLEAAGFEAFAPLIRAGKTPAPLFVGYLFVHIVDRWRAIDRTVGVLTLVKTGDVPAKCPDAEVAQIRKQMDADGLVRLPRPPNSSRVVGSKICIAAGPFRGIVGIYSGMSARHREFVLINLLGRQTQVELPADQLPTDVASSPLTRYESAKSAYPRILLRA